MPFPRGCSRTIVARDFGAKCREVIRDDCHSSKGRIPDRELGPWSRQPSLADVLVHEIDEASRHLKFAECADGLVVVIYREEDAAEKHSFNSILPAGCQTNGTSAIDHCMRKFVTTKSMHEVVIGEQAYDVIHLLLLYVLQQQQQQQ